MVRTRRFVHVVGGYGTEKYASIGVITRPSVFKRYKSVEVLEENHYRINKTLNINKDFEFPAGIYHLMPEVGVIGKKCQLTIQPGTIFYFSDYSFFDQIGGKFNALGNENNTIQFLAEESSINGWTALTNLEARIEHFKTLGFKGFNEDGRQLDSPFAIRSSKSHLKNCELTDNLSLMYGAGAYIEKGEATFDDCIIARNSTEYVGGAGVFVSKANVRFNKTKIMNNHTKNHGGGVNAFKECKLYFDDCQILGNIGSIAGVSVLISEAYFKNTIIRNNLHGGVVLIGPRAKAELDDDCIVEGNGEFQLLNGMHEGEMIYNKKILKKNTEPGANNLWAVVEEIRKKHMGKLDEKSSEIILNRTQKKYNLGESEMFTLNHAVQGLIELQNKPIDFDKFDPFKKI